MEWILIAVLIVLAPLAWLGWKFIKGAFDWMERR